MSAFMTRLKNAGKARDEMTQARPHALEAKTPFIAQNALEDALIATAEEPEEPEKQRAFTALLLDSDLYAPAVDASEEASAERRSPASGQVRLMTVRASDGEFLPALFTAEGRIAEIFGPDTRLMQLNGGGFLRRVMTQGAVLNPGCGYGMRWRPADIATMLGAPLERTVSPDTKFVLSTPEDPPEELIEHLTAILAADHRVEEAWLALAQWPDTSETAWYLDVRSTSSGDELAGELSKMLQQVPMASRPLDMVFNQPGDKIATGLKIKPLLPI